MLFCGDGNTSKSSEREPLQGSENLEEEKVPAYILSEEFPKLACGKTGTLVVVGAQVLATGNFLLGASGSLPELLVVQRG